MLFNRRILIISLAGVLLLVLVYLLSIRESELKEQEEVDNKPHENVVSGNGPAVIPVPAEGAKDNGKVSDERIQQKQE